MSTADILDELKHLNNAERLAVIETATRLIREDLGQKAESSIDETTQQLARAAEALLPDYASDEELVAFTSLDSEKFYAET